MMDIGVNVGISVNDNKKYGIYEAVIDWYAERLTYMYGGQSGKMNSGKEVLLRSLWHLTLFYAGYLTNTFYTGVRENAPLSNS